MKTQLNFKDLKRKCEFGGELLKKSKNRHARPVSTKDPMHLILKSTKAIGTRSFGHSKNLRIVKQTIDKACAKYAVKLQMYSNNFNHLHMLVKLPSRPLYLRFIRSLTGQLAMLLTGAKKNERIKEKFFDFRPFTRIYSGI